MTREEFIGRAKDAAVRASRISGFPPGITVAQAALESNFGESQLSRTANNYFGIKAHGNHPAMVFRTHEVKAGAEVSIVAKFAAYQSMDESFACRDRQIANGKSYSEARHAKDDPEAFAREIAKHWATDPMYAEKLLKIYRDFEFDQLDGK